MSFVINSHEWAFDHLHPDSHKLLVDSLLERVITALDRGEKIWIGESLQTKVVYQDKDFWTFMSCMPNEICQELSAWLDKAPLYIDEANFPDDLIENSLLSINGSPEIDNIDLSWAHYNNLQGIAVGCIGLQNSGVIKASSKLGATDIHIIKSEVEQLKFWRSAIDLEGNNSDKFRQLSQNAFPNLHFHNNVLSGLDELIGGYVPLRKEIMKYMSIFNDYGEWIFISPPPALKPGELSNNTGTPSNQIK